MLSHHLNTGVGEAGRRLIQPSEVMRLGRDKMVVFMRGLAHPILAERVRYYDDAAFTGLWDRWRSGVQAVVTLMVEHKPLRLEHGVLRIEEKPLRLEHKG